jgi:hypothetical protein
MADYAISNVARRVVYTNTGVGPYSFTFEILANTDIAVYRGSTLLTLTTDYSVTINANGTGSITLVTAGTGNITIVGSRAIQRTSDYTTGGDLFASTLNTDLDSQTIYAQQVAETAERGLKAPVTDPTDIAMTLPAKDGRKGKVLAFDSTTGNPVAGPALDAVTTVIEQSANINTVATNIASVNTVAGNTSNINTVAGISGNVTTVAGVSASVTTVAGISANVTTVAGNNANVSTVAGISGNVTTVAGISANVTTVAGISSNVSTVATNNANVTTVATNIASVNTAASDIAKIIDVANDLNEAVSEIDTVANNIANVNTVGNNIANVNTVAGISANVTTVAGISANVTAVAADATDIGTVATNIASVNTTATNIANVNTVATNIANVNAVAAEIPNLATKVNKTSDTGSAVIPSGTTAQRDGSPTNGYFRYNSSVNSFEGYVNGAWGGVGGAQAGGVIFENSLTISSNYTLTTSKNGLSVGPITINSGVSVTVPSGQRWVIL